MTETEECARLSFRREQVSCCFGFTEVLLLDFAVGWSQFAFWGVQTVLLIMIALEFGWSKSLFGYIASAFAVSGVLHRGTSF